MSESYDLVVIGTGGAAFAAGIEARSRGKSVLLVEHKMDVVRELADRIIVLHNGQLVADGEPAEVIASPIVQQAYLGMPSAGADDAVPHVPAPIPAVSRTGEGVSP